MANQNNKNPDAVAGNDTHPVIKCESVYKIFGENADSMVRRSNGNIDVAAFQTAAEWWMAVMRPAGRRRAG